MSISTFTLHSKSLKNLPGQSLVIIKFDDTAKLMRFMEAKDFLDKRSIKKIALFESIFSYFKIIYKNIKNVS